MENRFGEGEEREECPEKAGGGAPHSTSAPTYQVGDQVGFRCLSPKDISRPYCPGVVRQVKHTTMTSCTYVVMLEQTDETVEIPKLYAEVLLKPLHQIPQSMLECPEDLGSGLNG